MSKAITISGSNYIIKGTVKDNITKEGIEDLHVIAYDEDLLADDFLGIAVTDSDGNFTLSFDRSKFSLLSIWDRAPDLYFEVKDGGLVLLSTKDSVIENANESTPPINFTVDMSHDILRKDINNTPAPGWVGGFEKTNPAFAYPTPDLSSLDMLENMANIKKLDRQQKVLWPEFSWETKPGEEDPERCFQMFAPDISRLGYDKDGRVYSIICPQQGTASPHLGSMNVEVTVTGNRGWANETNRELAADISVKPSIWFSPSAHKSRFVKLLGAYFKAKNLPFPSSKEKAIRLNTFNPGQPDNPNFALTNGSSTNFPIPEFAKHEGISWSLGHLAVEIGKVEKTNVEIVDKFNQLVMDAFNTASGNMLKEGNILTWNVWFTAPQKVDQDEWEGHAEKWRKSIDADHGSPDGPGTVPRFFDGSPFKPVKEILIDELPAIVAFIKEHLNDHHSV